MGKVNKLKEPSSLEKLLLPYNVEGDSGEKDLLQIRSVQIFLTTARDY